MAEDTGTPEGGTPATPATPVVVTPTTPVTPAPAQASGVADWEKQRTGLTNDLKKEREARQRFESQAQKFQTELDAERGRVRALAGVNAPAPGEAEAEEVRKRFAQLYPHLGGLTATEIQEMREMAQERKSLQETTNHYWKTHGQAMVKSIQKEVEATYGGELSDRQQQAITKAYVLRLQADPEALTRHENGDQALVKEFAKEWIEDWFEPARRKVTATQVGQFRPTPSGKDRGTVTSGEKKIDVNNNDQVMDLLVSGRTFTGRK